MRRPFLGPQAAFARTPAPYRQPPRRRAALRRGSKDRLAPTTFHVTGVLDDGSAGTLSWAVGQANANPGPR